MANGRSIDWTLDRAVGLIRITANAVAPDKFENDTLADILHEKLLQVHEMLGEAGIDEYIQKQDLTLVSKVADISTYRVDTIIAMRSSTSGVECSEKGTKEFEKERLRAQITGGTKSIIWSRYGKNVEFDYGSSVTPGTITMVFKAIPEKKTYTTPTETIDIPDKWVPLVLDLAEAKIYEIMHEAPPESLAARVQANTDKIREASASEKARIKGTK